MNMTELIEKATTGSLEQDELEAVVECLQTNTCPRYEALLVIGRSGAVQYRDLVESYLDTREDPMLARLALMILCRYWHLSSEYQEQLEAFARGVEWDESDDIRLLAISILGTFLATQY